MSFNMEQLIEVGEALSTVNVAVVKFNEQHEAAADQAAMGASLKNVVSKALIASRLATTTENQDTATSIKRADESNRHLIQLIKGAFENATDLGKHLLTMLSIFLAMMTVLQDERMKSSIKYTASRSAAEADEQVEAARTEAAAQVQAARTEASEQVEAAGTEAATRVQAARTEATEQVQEARTEATTRVETVQADAAAQLEAALAQAEQMRGIINQMTSLATSICDSAGSAPRPRPAPLGNAATGNMRIE